MKNNIKCDIFTPFLKKGLFAVLGGLALVSCGSIPTGYTEADGIYYDPSTDKLERITMRDTPNQVGEEYDYHTENETIEPNRTIEQANRNQQLQTEKYKSWSGGSQSISGSDWGTYTGTQNNYYNNYSWGYPYYNGIYSPYYFGGYNSYFYFGNHYNYGWNLGFSWGSPYYYNYYHNPYYNGYRYYNPWYYNNYYAPYYSPHYYYRPYGRRYEPYYYDRYYTPQNRNYRRSGADSIYRGRENRNYNNQSNRVYNQNNNPNTGWGRPNNGNNGYRESNWNRSNDNNYQTQPRDNSWRNSSGSGNYNGGSGNNSNPGGFRRGGGF